MGNEQQKGNSGLTLEVIQKDPKLSRELARWQKSTEEGELNLCSRLKSPENLAFVRFIEAPNLNKLYLSKAMA